MTEAELVERLRNEIRTPSGLNSSRSPSASSSAHPPTVACLEAALGREVGRQVVCQAALSGVEASFALGGGPVRAKTNAMLRAKVVVVDEFETPCDRSAITPLQVIRAPALEAITDSPTRCSLVRRLTATVATEDRRFAGWTVCFSLWLPRAPGEEHVRVRPFFAAFEKRRGRLEATLVHDVHLASHLFEVDVAIESFSVVVLSRGPEASSWTEVEPCERDNLAHPHHADAVSHEIS